MAEADMMTLNRKRANLKGQITKISKTLSENQDTMELSELQAQLDIILKIQGKLDTLKEEYYKIVPDENLPDIEEAISQLDENLQTLEVSVKTSINKLKCEKVIEVNSTKEHSFQNSVSQIKLAKLPKIPIPLFSGRYEEFNLFKTQFMNLISNNPELTESEKLYYLRGSLKGEAKMLETSDDTFNSLFKALELRYDNKRAIVDCHIKNILGMQPIKNESARELRNLLDNVKKNLRSLQILEFKGDKLSNALLLNVILEKLDRETRKNYELTLKDNEVPDFDVFLEFLERRCQILNSIHNTNTAFEASQERNKSLSAKPKRYFNSKVLTSVTENTNTCIYCSRNHTLVKCTQFLNLTPKEKLNFSRFKRLCYNCLSSLHGVSACKSTNTCKKCNKFHNTLLHVEKETNSKNENMRENPIISNSLLNSNLSPSANIFTPLPNESAFAASDLQTVSQNGTVLTLSSNVNKQVLLSTAMIYVKNKNGEFVKLRALLDNGSMSNFLTYQGVQLLDLPRKKINASISGLNENMMQIKEATVATIANADKSFLRTLNFFVVPKIARISPVKYLRIAHLNKLQHFELADPEFNVPGPIHVLLSNEIFFELLGPTKISTQELIFQETVFGFIASGSVRMPHEHTINNYCGLVKSVVVDDLSSIMKGFWEIETVHESKQFKSPEETYCEEHFLRTHTRKQDGRYEVEMPIKEDGLMKLGESRENAYKRLNSLLRRFKFNPIMQNLYEDFINEYHDLGHSELISEENSPNISYYLPHHGIYRPDKPSTKIRVVFDASATTTSGFSLNDILLNGGTVQDELFDIICRFRTYQFVFTADIVKMYRQILIKESQRDLLRILWKNTETDSLKVYRLNTITYGTSNAPYLATRTLKQLAEDEGKSLPLAAQAVNRDFYVDDVLSGAHTLAEAQEMQSQLIELLARGGMHLHKWCANHPSLLQHTSGNEEYSFSISENVQNAKTLGLLWNTASDSFSFHSSVKESAVYTKRTILADIARIFDPLGLIGPGITKAKIFIQKLWLQKVDWNDQLPENIVREWKLFVTSMQAINKLNISRYVLHNNFSKIQLHGFSDASENAYGAAIYVRCLTNTKPVSNLLCSKSRVAPLKPLTVPRLELCAAVLLALLVSKVMTLLKLDISEVWLWCDSQIVLAWIQTSPHMLKTFVANRVLKIQELTQMCKWNYIRSEDNPADIVSRGINFDSLNDYDLWWHGPLFLREEGFLSNTDIHLQSAGETPDYLTELKQKTVTLTVTVENDFIDYILNISNSYIKLLRILSYVFRFVWNLKNPSQRKKGWVHSEELTRAEYFMIREVQKKEFHLEYVALAQGKLVSNKSKLLSLAPFLDNNGVLRVSGRLKNAELNFSQKHQIILPAKNKLSYLIAEYYHKKFLHVGSQGLLYCIRQKYWPLHGRNLTRRVSHTCVICSKNNPVTIEQLMGSLPKERVIPNAPFNYVGVDFAGYFLIKYKGQRKGIFHKVYLAIFICFITKAVHLEIVSDLTTDAFIAAFKRFVARRGKSAVVFSDNAKNFVGANAELKKLNNLVKQPEEKLASYLAEEGIDWRFIPPRTPNFGGLWEAGIKSVKFHLKRTVGNARLTFEELLTVVTQIESILNSRPLTPLSSDANDLEALTPGHFLIGRPLTAIAEPEIININENRLSRWHRITRSVQLIWKRWHREYLNTLQPRNKWKSEKDNINIGTLVLVKEDGLPVNNWVLGRITNVFPGTDKKVRVFEIRTARGTIKRGISKIAVLPLNDNISSSS